jgi:hypothetical protein
MSETEKNNPHACLLAQLAMLERHSGRLIWHYEGTPKERKWRKLNESTWRGIRLVHEEWGKAKWN